MIPKSLEEWSESNDKIIGEKSSEQEIKEELELDQIKLTE